MLQVWHGRIVDRAGDGLLTEFRSAQDALHWALDVQNRLTSDGTLAPIQVRIALHLGDVSDGPDGEIYGDGVNLTARLQAYADPGCIIASRPLIDALSGRISVPCLDLGELKLRNIASPTHAFVLRPTQDPPTTPFILQTQPDPRPSIAVLPFAMMTAIR